LPGVEQTFATPIQLSGESQKVPGRAPGIGEHSREILKEFGMDELRIAELEAAGIVVQGS
jgi:formyl-CoA transferase